MLYYHFHVKGKAMGNLKKLSIYKFFVPRFKGLAAE